MVEGGGGSGEGVSGFLNILTSSDLTFQFRGRLAMEISIDRSGSQDALHIGYSGAWKISRNLELSVLV